MAEDKNQAAGEGPLQFITRRLSGAGPLEFLAPVAAAAAAVYNQSGAGWRQAAVLLACLGLLTLVSHYSGRRAAAAEGRLLPWREVAAKVRGKLFGYLIIWVSAAAVLLALPGWGGEVAFYGTMGWMFASELKSVLESEKRASGVGPGSDGSPVPFRSADIVNSIGSQAPIQSPPQPPPAGPEPQPPPGAPGPTVPYGGD